MRTAKQEVSRYSAWITAWGVACLLTVPFVSGWRIVALIAAHGSVTLLLLKAGTDAIKAAPVSAPREPRG